MDDLGPDGLGHCLIMTPVNPKNQEPGFRDRNEPQKADFKPNKTA